MTKRSKRGRGARRSTLARSVNLMTPTRAGVSSAVHFWLPPSGGFRRWMRASVETAPTFFDFVRIFFKKHLTMALPHVIIPRQRSRTFPFSPCRHRARSVDRFTSMGVFCRAGRLLCAIFYFTGQAPEMEVLLY